MFYLLSSFCFSCCIDFISLYVFTASLLGFCKVWDLNPTLGVWDFCVGFICPWALPLQWLVFVVWFSQRSYYFFPLIKMTIFSSWYYSSLLEYYMEISKSILYLRLSSRISFLDSLLSLTIGYHISLSYHHDFFLN